MSQAMSNFTASQSPQFQILNDNQCAMIVESALRVLEHTGCIVKHERSRNILKEIGARVEDNRVYIPSHLIDHALRTAPKQITIYDLNGNAAVKISARNAHSAWCPGVANIYIIDRHTGERRLATKQDAYEAGLLLEALPNYDLITGLAYISDVKPEMADIYEMRTLISASTKPHWALQTNRDNMEAEIKLFSTVAGGKEKFLTKPTAIFSCAPTTPLGHEEDVLERCLLQWEEGVPASYAATTLMGGTGPATLEGGLITGLADTLVGLVLSQAVNEGTPFIGGIGAVPFDMAITSPALSSPEAALCAAATADLFRFINIPSMNYLGGSASQTFDHQAANDMTMQIMSGVLSGSNFNVFSGFLDNANSGALEALVYGNEVLDMMKVYAKGIEISEEAAAEAVIDAVGPLGNYLGEEHTMKHFRETWMPKAFCRTTFDYWDKKEFKDRAVEKIDTVVANGPSREIDEAMAKELDEIVAFYDAKY